MEVLYHLENIFVCKGGHILRKISLCLAFILIFSTFNVFADNTATHKNKLNNVKKSISNVNSALKQNKQQQQNVQSRINELSGQINQKRKSNS